jgi:hypothetical protein
MTPKRIFAGALVVGMATLGLAARAQANGALPATIQVLLPPAAPSTIIVATNFGLVTSIDGGGHWQWICEHGLGDQGAQYQLAGPASTATNHRLFALATAGLVFSDDLGCGWSQGLAADAALPFDHFPDPSDGRRALVLGIVRSAVSTHALFDVTVDGTGANVRTLYTSGDEALTTVEIARARPKTVYMTLATRGGGLPARLGRSEDGGATWTMLTPAPPVSNLGIVAVDPGDASTLLFRVEDDQGDKLALSNDAGKTLRIVLAPPQRIMSSFVWLPSGHVLVGWEDAEGGHLDRGVAPGGPFTALATPFHPRALAERDGKIYAATDIASDAYALAVSSDEGDSWTRVMAFADVETRAACASPSSNLAATCAASCDRLAALNTLPGEVCTRDQPPGTDADAGASADAAQIDVAAPTPAAPSSGGCSCTSAGPPTRPTPGGFLHVLVALTALALRHAASLRRYPRGERSRR